MTAVMFQLIDHILREDIRVITQQMGLRPETLVEEAELVRRVAGSLERTVYQCTQRDRTLLIERAIRTVATSLNRNRADVDIEGA